MSAFLYGVSLHFKINIRNKGILVCYYIMPIIFYLFMGGVFTTINPEAYKTIIPVMSVFSVTVAGVLGSPYNLVEFYGSEIKKGYQVGGIPLWTIAAGNFISGILHLFLVSIFIFVTAPILFDALIPENLVQYFIALCLIIIASLSIGTVFGLFFKDTSKMGMAAQLIFLPSIMLSGIMFPVSMLPEAIQNLGKVLPATWGFLAMCKSKLDFSSFWPLLVITAIMLLISAWKLSKIRVE